MVGFPIKYKRVVILIDKVQKDLSFPKIIKFNVIIYLNLIEESNVLHLKKLDLSFISFYFLS